MSDHEIKFSRHFYLDFLSFMRYRFPSIYWGEDNLGYYWGDDNKKIKCVRCSSLQETVESISSFLHLYSSFE